MKRAHTLPRWAEVQERKKELIVSIWSQVGFDNIPKVTTQVPQLCVAGSLLRRVFVAIQDYGAFTEVWHKGIFPMYLHCPWLQLMLLVSKLQAYKNLPPR